MLPLTYFISPPSSSLWGATVTGFSGEVTHGDSYTLSPEKAF